MRIFSGIQPTGIPHIGNYLGALKNWVDLQNSGKYECIYPVVDLHAMTIPYDPKTFSQTILESAAILLSVGISPEKSTIFIQSHRPEHTELAWILNTITAMGELNRMTQYKEKSDQYKDMASAGLFNYPVLMAADILLYKADRVPVGEDQLQHLELARILARRFNSRFGETFPEPQPILSPTPRVMSLKDPSKKMSKSVPGSYLSITDTDDEIRDIIRRATTDSTFTRQSTTNGTRMNNSSAISRASAGTGGQKDKSPAIANLFVLLKAFTDENTYQNFAKQYQNSTIKYTELKDALADAIIITLAPIRKRFAELMLDPDLLKHFLSDGAAKLAPIANATIKEVKKSAGLIV